MVKFIGGPSFGGYSAYRNHTIARPGQWRMPRNYGFGSTRVTIKNYNYCNHGGYGFGFQLPAWMQWANFGLNWMQQLIGMFAPQQPLYQQPLQEKPEENPLQKQIDDLTRRLDEQNKAFEEYKKEHPETPVVENVEEDDPLANVDGGDGENDDATITIKHEVTPAVADEPDTPTTEKVFVPKCDKAKTDSANVWYHGWNTLTKAYGIDNSLAFRNWFRIKYLGGKDIWETGKDQHFPKKLEYPEGSSKTYEFNSTTFLAEGLDKHDRRDGTVNIGNTQEGAVVQGKKGTPEQHKCTGTLSYTYGGKTYSATATVTEGADNTAREASVKAKLKANIKAQIKTDLLAKGKDDSTAESLAEQAATNAMSKAKITQ